MGLDSSINDDLDFGDQQRHDALTGEPRYLEDEVRNTTFSMVFGGIAAISCLVAMILTWVLYHRDRNSSLMWHGIWLIFAFLFSIICVVWALMSRNSVKMGRPANSMLTLMVFIAGLFFFGYLLVEALWFVFYRSVHFDYLVGLSSDQGKWNNFMPSGISFNDGWIQSRRLLWWMVFFTLIAAIAIAYIAYSSRSVVWNRYTLTRYGLYAGIFMTFICSWVVLYWVAQCINIQGYLGSTVTDISNILRGLRVLAILCLVFGFLMLVVNFIKSKLGYFILGVITIILFILVLSIAGLLWREVRNQSTVEQNNGDNTSCSVTMNTINENDLNNWCPTGSKYLAPGVTCGKEFLVLRWEGQNEVRSLNPACCLVAKYFYLWPLMMLAYWTTALTLCLTVIICCAFYLGDTSEYLTNSNKVFSLGDILGFVLALLALIGFGIYYWLRPNYIISNNSIKNYQPSYIDPSKNAIPGFDPVPYGILNRTNIMQNNFGPIPPRVCFPYNTTTLPYPAFQTAGSGCNNPSSCLIRLALALKGGTFQIGGSGNAVRAIGDSRYVFFPNCSGVFDDYVMFYGTAAQIQSMLGSLAVCPTDIALLPTLNVYTDQVSSSSITNYGTLNNETNTLAAANSVTSQCLNGFSNASCANKAACNYTNILQDQLTYVTLKGQLFYLSNGQSRNDVPPNVTVTAYDNVGPIKGVNYTLFINGVFSLAVIPKYNNATYRLRLVINDPTGVFLQKTKDVVIDQNTGSEVSAGQIRMNTKDGRVCSASDATCLANQAQLTGNIIAVVNDGSSYSVKSISNRLQGANVAAIPQFVVEGVPIQNLTTDTNGVATLSNLPYNAYAIIATKTGYKPSLQLVDLQEPSNNMMPFFLSPTVPDYDAKVVGSMYTPSTDFDLVVQMSSDTGAYCECSPYNKYCPYSGYMNDVTSGPGEEDVIIERLSVATYNAFIRPSIPYNTSCPSAAAVQNNAYHFSSQLDWQHLQGSTPPLIMPGMLGGRADFGFDFSLLSFLRQILLIYPRELPVEPDTAAKVNKTVVNYNGFPYLNGTGPSWSSYYRDYDAKQNLKKPFVYVNASEVNGTSVQTNNSSLFRFIPFNIDSTTIQNYTDSVVNTQSPTSSVNKSSYNLNASTNKTNVTSTNSTTSFDTGVTRVYNNVSAITVADNGTTVSRANQSTIDTSASGPNTSIKAENISTTVNGTVLLNRTLQTNETNTSTVNKTSQFLNSTENSSGTVLNTTRTNTTSNSSTDSNSTLSLIQVQSSPNNTNFSLNNQTNITNSSGNVSLTSLVDFKQTFISGVSVATLGNATVNTSPNGTNYTLVNNQTTTLASLSSDNNSILANFTNSTSFNNGTVYLNQTLLNTTIKNDSNVNYTTQQITVNLNTSANPTVDLSHAFSCADLPSGHLQSYTLAQPASIVISDLLTLYLQDHTGTNASRKAMNSQSGFTDVKSVTENQLSTLTASNITAQRTRTKSVQIKSASGTVLHSTTGSSIIKKFAPVANQSNSTFFNITLNRNTTDNGVSNVSTIQNLTSITYPADSRNRTANTSSLVNNTVVNTSLGNNLWNFTNTTTVLNLTTTPNNTLSAASNAPFNDSFSNYSANVTITLTTSGANTTNVNNNSITRTWVASSVNSTLISNNTSTSTVNSTNQTGNNSSVTTYSDNFTNTSNISISWVNNTSGNGSFQNNNTFSNNTSNISTLTSTLNFSFNSTNISNNTWGANQTVYLLTDLQVSSLTNQVPYSTPAKNFTSVWFNSYNFTQPSLTTPSATDVVNYTYIYQSTNQTDNTSVANLSITNITNSTNSFGTNATTLNSSTKICDSAGNCTNTTNSSLVYSSSSSNRNNTYNLKEVLSNLTTQDFVYAFTFKESVEDNSGNKSVTNTSTDSRYGNSSVELAYNATSTSDLTTGSTRTLTNAIYNYRSLRKVLAGGARPTARNYDYSFVSKALYKVTGNTLSSWDNTTKLEDFLIDVNNNTYNSTVNYKVVAYTNRSSTDFDVFTSSNTSSYVFANTSTNLSDVGYSSFNTTSILSYDSNNLGVNSDFFWINVSISQFNKTFNYNATGFAGPYRTCNQTITYTKKQHTNGSNITNISDITWCYKDATNGVITFNTTFGRVDQAGGANLSNWNYSSYTANLATNTSTNTSYVATGVFNATATTRRRLLMEEESTQIPRKRITQVHAQAPGSFLWLTCFTGFGSSSEVGVNAVQDAQPTIADCRARILSAKPTQTDTQLRQAVNDWKKNNPN